MSPSEIRREPAERPAHVGAQAALATSALLLSEHTPHGLEATEAIGATEAIYEVIASSDHEEETLAAIVAAAAV